MLSAAKHVRPDVIVLCHGGPIATPADAQYILNTCRHCDGFYGASSMERLPVEIAITERTREFRDLATPIRKDTAHDRVSQLTPHRLSWCELEQFEIIYTAA